MTGVEVTQADRDAVFAYWNHPAEHRIVPITAVSDDHALVQAFARYRAEARSAALEEAAKVADRNAKWHEEAFRKEMILKHEERQTHFAARHREAEEIATAIRSLSRSGGERTTA